MKNVEDMSQTEYDEYTRQQGAIGAAAQYQAQMDAAGFAQAENEISNTREFYLENRELLDTFYCYLTGRGSIDDVRDEELAMMKDKSAKFIVTILVMRIDKLVGLSDFDDKEIRNHTYRTREIVSGWLMLEGWVSQQMNFGYFPSIVHQVELISLASLKRAKKKGWQHFMNTSVRSIENVSYMNSPGMRSGGGGVPPRSPNSKGGLRKLMPF